MKSTNTQCLQSLLRRSNDICILLLLPRSDNNRAWIRSEAEIMVYLRLSTFHKTALLTDEKIGGRVFEYRFPSLSSYISSLVSCQVVLRLLVLQSPHRSPATFRLCHFVQSSFEGKGRIPKRLSLS